MIVINRTMATLKIKLDGADKELTYPSDKLDNLRLIHSVLKEAKEVGGDDEEVLDQTIKLIEGAKDAVRQIVGSEQYDHILGGVEDDIPLMAWIEILQRISGDIQEYMSRAVGTEGEL